MTHTQESGGSAVAQVLFHRDAQELYGPDGFAPATEGSAGIDLRACCPEASLRVAAGERVKIGTGVSIAPRQPGMAGFVYSRSGLGAVKGLVVAQGVGVIDPDYRGEIYVFLLNTSHDAIEVAKGERIAQLVFQPFFRVTPTLASALDVTERGEGGFGHTGRR